MLQEALAYDNQEGKEVERPVCKALEDYYNDAKMEGKIEGRSEGVEQGVRGIISVCKDFGGDRSKAKAEIIKAHELQEEVAEKYLALYW